MAVGRTKSRENKVDDDGNGVQVEWTVSDGLKLEATVQLVSGGPALISINRRKYVQAPVQTSKALLFKVYTLSILCKETWYTQSLYSLDTLGREVIDCKIERQ